MLAEPELCDQCLEVYSETDSLRKFDFCSIKCEAGWAEENAQYVVKVRGNFPRIGYVDGEKFTFLRNPPMLVNQIESYHNPGKFRSELPWNHPMDLFTFLGDPREKAVCYPQYHFERDNFAMLRVRTFDEWWTQQVDAKTRNMVRKAEKKGIEVKEIPLGEELFQGICAINNEVPIRQGRKFPYYGTTLEWTRGYASTFPTRSIFFGAYLDGKLIGFLKMVMDHDRDYACILHILSMVEHRDKAPTNALIAQAVRSCADRGISQLAYDRFSYGKKEGDSLAEFKVNNGFERVDVPRYYVTMTVRGAIARRLGLHRKLSEQVPEFIASRFRDLREGWLRRAHQG